MADKEKIDYLLLDIKELERLIVEMRDAEIYPVSFFSQGYGLTQKILTELHKLESDQLETLRQQVEVHREMINSIPLSEPRVQPEIIHPAEPERIEEPIIIPAADIIEPEENIPEETATPQKEETITILEAPEAEEANNEPDSSSESSWEQVAEEKQTPTIFVKESILIEKGKEIVAEKKSAVFLSELLEKKQLSDLKKAISLNDRFRFRKELFDGSDDKMAAAIADLNNLSSYDESIAYLHDVLEWKDENEAVADFIALLEKRFL